MTFSRATRTTIVAVAMIGVTRAGYAQTEYYDLDASRPLRVEDATPTERYALDLELAPLRFERYAGGTTRWRVDPKATFGLLPMTEVEVRVPIVLAVPPGGSGASSTFGTAAVGVGLLHAFNVETRAVPAFALGTEVLLPSGSLSGPEVSYSLRALMTKTTVVGRFNVNAAYGTYSVRPAAAAADTSCHAFRLSITPTACSNSVPYDVPCALVPSVGVAAPGVISSPIDVPRFCDRATAGPRMLSAPARFDPARANGDHWVAILGYDRPFGVGSTLVSGDVVAERFMGLYALTDWIAEVGVRHQLSPRVVLDLGVGRHFAGVVQSSMATIGATYELQILQSATTGGR